MKATHLGQQAEAHRGPGAPTGKVSHSVLAFLSHARRVTQDTASCFPAQGIQAPLLLAAKEPLGGQGLPP